MKGLIIILFAAFVLQVNAGDPVRTELFDCANVTGDTSRAIYLKGEELGFAQVDFTSTNCNTSKMKVGYGLVDSIMNYPAKVNDLSNPVVLDKTATDPNDAGKLLYRHTIYRRGIKYDKSAFAVYLPEWRAYYMFFTLTGACTAGKIYLITK